MPRRDPLEVALRADVLEQHTATCSDCGFDSLEIATVVLSLNDVPQDTRTIEMCGRCEYEWA